jgi:hypothetical protein
MELELAYSVAILAATAVPPSKNLQGKSDLLLAWWEHMNFDDAEWLVPEFGFPVGTSSKNKE